MIGNEWNGKSQGIDVRACEWRERGPMGTALFVNRQM